MQKKALSVLDTFSEPIQSADEYCAKYANLLPLFIAHGRPSQDTLRTYVHNIDAFLGWCREHNYFPLDIHDYQMRIYVNSLVSAELKDSTIALKIIAVRTFFMMARRLGLITDNPCEHIHTSVPSYLDSRFYFFSVDQIGEICKYFQNEPDDFIRLRGLITIFLMGVEGLRVVEVQRACLEDIDIAAGIMTVRGKGHQGVIYLSEATVSIIQQYLKACKTLVKDIEKDETGTPLIVSLAHFRTGQRIGRDCIRKNIINPALAAAGYKMKGQSCHIFRHSCGTNLYRETKDLRVVQEQLRQRDPKVTARYAHVQEKMSKRLTNMLNPLAGSK